MHVGLGPCKADYTSHPIADYGVSDMGCTEQGLRISEGMGRHLPQLDGSFAHAKLHLHDAGVT
eukprot:9532426-Karenia_brevis.AAC.1